MNDKHIENYQINFLENTFSNDFERLKAIKYGLEYILNGMEYDIETDDQRQDYNSLDFCLEKISKIIEKNEE